MNKQKIKDKIFELFSKYHAQTMFDSTGTWGKDQHQALIDYCNNHKEEFKEFAEEFLSEPKEECFIIANICNEVLDNIDTSDGVILHMDNPDFIEQLSHFIANAAGLSKNINNSLCHPEDCLWDGCNYWLNRFKGTENIDYYKDWKLYKRYLDKHYIGWNPIKEDDPNPTFNEFKSNIEKYKI